MLARRLRLMKCRSNKFTYQKPDGTFTCQRGWEIDWITPQKGSPAKVIDFVSKTKKDDDLDQEEK